MPPTRRALHHGLIARARPAACLLALTGLFFAVRIWHGIWFIPFQDEYCHFVGGMMLNHGAILYRTFIEQHGPVNFMLTQVYGALFGWRHPNAARLICVALALGTTYCVAQCTLFRDSTSKLWAAALFCGLTASVWLVQGLYFVSYHTIGGLLMAMAIALFVAPAWLQAPVTGRRAGIAAACLVLAIGTAYPFAPTAAALGASGLWAAAKSPSAIKGFAWGAALACTALLAWMLAFADIPGYFAYHFIENQLVFSKYVTGWDIFLHGITPSADPDALVNTMGLWLYAASCAGFVTLLYFRSAPPRPKLAPMLLGFAGMLPLLTRGTLFQDGAFLVIVFALFAIACPVLISRCVPQPGAYMQAACSVLLALCIAGAEITARHAHYTPFGMPRSQAVQQPRFQLGLSDDPIFARIRALTTPADRILAVPFQPDVYIKAGRMPTDGYYYYLPWNAEYAADPWFVRKHDLCADLQAAPPKLIDFNNWHIWNRYWMATYAPCFIAILGRHYAQLPDFPNLWLRRGPPGT